ncbi:GliT [Lasiodiplodia theobromae]|nr:GliT [Lasiodiplodia theobromae]
MSDHILRQAHVPHAAIVELEHDQKGFESGAATSITVEFDASRSVQCLICDGFGKKGHSINVVSFGLPAYGHVSVMAPNLDSFVTIYSNGPISGAVLFQQALNTVLVTGNLAG